MIRRSLSLVWEAPQTALGAAMLGAEAARKRVVQIEVEDGRLVVESKGTGISLGHIVFWSRESSRWHDLDVRNHFQGHLGFCLLSPNAGRSDIRTGQG